MRDVSTKFGYLLFAAVILVLYQHKIIDESGEQGSKSCSQSSDVTPFEFTSEFSANDHDKYIVIFIKALTGIFGSFHYAEPAKADPEGENHATFFKISSG